ncbi:MAG: RNA-directed DNA polymerase [Bacillota bacterium]|nr:RNA-directed DNA polymerase [Bacillota bacterium]
MKSFNIDSKLTDLDVIKRAIVTVCKSKRKKPRGQNRKYKQAQYILKNTDKCAERILEMVQAFDRVHGARERGLPVDPEDVELMYKPKQCEPFEIRDAGSGKKRMIISVPIYPDQIIHQLLIEASKPVFMRGMYEYSLGSIPDGGIHKGKKYLEKTIKRHQKYDKSAIKYAVELDIEKCYPSINHEILKAQLKKKFRGKLFVWLSSTVIDSYYDRETFGQRYGLPLGYSTSHWFCNFYLTPVDHYIKNDLGIEYYIRYMDDMIFFGRNKKALHEAVRAIMRYIGKLQLKIKGNWQVFRFDYIDRVGRRRGRAIDTLGFRFFRDKIILRKRLALTIRRAVKRVAKMKKVTAHAAQSLMSRLGWLRHFHSYNFYHEYVLPYISIRKLKGVIRNASRKHNQAVQAV